MKYDLSNFPVGENDKQFVDETGELVNYRKLLMVACLKETDGNGQPIQGMAKMQRFDIYMKLKAAIAVIELPADDVKLLSDAALAYPTLLAGQVRLFLDQKLNPYVEPIPPK